MSRFKFVVDEHFQPFSRVHLEQLARLARYLVHIRTGIRAEESPRDCAVFVYGCASTCGDARAACPHGQSHAAFQDMIEGRTHKMRFVYFLAGYGLYEGYVF